DCDTILPKYFRVITSQVNLSFPEVFSHPMENFLFTLRLTIFTGPSISTYLILIDAQAISPCAKQFLKKKQVLKIALPYLLIAGFCTILQTATFTSTTCMQIRWPTQKCGWQNTMGSSIYLAHSSAPLHWHRM